MDRRRRGINFYRVVLPGFTLVNLGLGVLTSGVYFSFDGLFQCIRAVKVSEL